ncbi:ankyrin [Bacillus sp. FJAT-18017]|uniref:ankyrin repeat domain-containing protein n=1 Tax=Bacillus sp. FJAT-18017 TaxID=1705566 RepID=UPI0006AFCD95|nr:ankyrin repeat domain-containing protein [Bacillus sp. FJAT-18017]ALC89080.1 ankyrin [Bacillus sp. FJAT-18017]
MATENADIYTLAKFVDLESFISNFDQNQLNVKSSSGSGLLHYAISGNRFDIASFLINQGIDVNMTNADGQTALHLVCVNQDLTVAKQLLERGIDVNLKDKYGNNAMWTAVFNCKGRSYEMVELFMNYHPDIQNKNKAGRSPLDFAKQVGNERLINTLLEEK